MAKRDTLEWFINEGYRDEKHTKAILGDMTSGNQKGIKKRRLDEIDVLFQDSAEKNISEVYTYDEDLTRYGEIWNDVPQEYKAQEYITIE